MMRFLLDTHVLLWWLFDDPKLPEKVRSIIADSEHNILVSSAAAFEISTKHRLGKLDVPSVLIRDFSGCMTRAGFNEIPISIRHAMRAGSWRHPHRDPFDRIFAAQSAVEEVPLITSDAVLGSFDIEIIWI